MCRSLAYCLFVVLALGATSFRHVTSLSYDVIRSEVSSRRQDANSRLSTERNLDETRSDVSDGADANYILSHDVGQGSDKDIDRTGDQLNDGQRLTSDDSFKRGAAGNKAKFLFGRSWPGPEKSRGGAAIGGSLARGKQDGTANGYDSKRQEARRHFKFGKKSLDIPRADNDSDSFSSMKKRKMIKFGKKSTGNGIDYLVSA